MDDVDLSQNSFLVTGKGLKQRIVPFSTIMRNVLLQYLNNSRPKMSLVSLDYLFPTKFGENVSVNSVQQALIRLGGKVGYCSPSQYSQDRFKDNLLIIPKS